MIGVTSSGNIRYLGTVSMSALFEYLQKLPASLSILALSLSLLTIVFFKWEKIMNSIKWILGRGGKQSKRTCGDCVLLLFGIREKYEYKAKRLDTSLLRMQMKFAEQKIQEVIFFLSQSFAEDIKVNGEGEEQEKKAVQSALYCEALKNGMLSVKDELRRSFKENNFGEFSEKEYAHYVQDKTRVMLTTVRLYLNQHYVDGEGTIVHLKERFERMDKYHMQQFESWAFEVFTNAKDLMSDVKKKKKQIHGDLKREIDEFIKNEQNSPNC